MHHFDFAGRHILVVGDMMLDRYLDGSVERISPEAPVPVIASRAERVVLGGAANVVVSIATLGGTVDCIGVVGDDEPGRTLGDLLRRHEAVHADHLVIDPGRPTTCKMRVMSGFHQLIRIDAESKDPLRSPVEDEVIAAIEKVLPAAEVVVISDYAKGVCTDRVIRAVIDMANRASKPIIVDPKRADFSIYRGASLIKPNRRELAAATQLPCETDSEAEAAAASVIAWTGSAVLLTRSEHGMSHFAAGSEPLHLATAAREVFDVSGAGDTVVALAALGLAAQLPIAEVMRLANAAAGIVVGKVGTATVSVEELEAVLDLASHAGPADKGALVSLGDAVRMRRRWGRQGLRVGFTNGCYDLLHPGHVSLLKSAAEACDRLIVGLNSDASVRRLKGETRPVQDEASRATVIGALSATDLVLIFEEDTPAEVIEALVPDVLIKGADYTVDQVVGAETVQKAGGRVLLVPVVQGQSTTAMIRRANA